MKIGIFDSGKGGLTVLNEIKKLLPDYEYIYVGDSKNNPYGEKSEEELIEITTKISKFLICNNCKIIVIACNTATTRCMKTLRKKFPDTIFIGTVPAIKVACDNNYKNILLLATTATINSKRVEELVKDNKKEGQEIYLKACPNLASSIEADNKEKINSLLNEYLKDYKGKNIDCIVLGCTHYPIVKEEINNIIHCNIIDGGYGVAKEVKHQIELNNLILDKSNSKTAVYNTLTDNII